MPRVRRRRCRCPPAGPSPGCSGWRRSRTRSRGPADRRSHRAGSRPRGSVGVVIASASRYVFAASAHATLRAIGVVRLPNGVYSSRFSGMKWFVPMIRMPRSCASRATPRPTTMWDWMCTTSGCRASMTGAVCLRTVQGQAKRYQAWAGHRYDARRWTVRVTPRCSSSKEPWCVRFQDGAMTCTSCPRSASPTASLFGEGRRAVHVGGERVGGDEDPQRPSPPGGGRGVGRLGRGVC